mmetsp:Transcript_44935/g.107408  ORF Transcript_44935/g.107408 Transcript_44935/m.107408 type:complete len:245 (-) Transcript_44935:131-865(-)
MGLRRSWRLDRGPRARLQAAGPPRLRRGLLRRACGVRPQARHAEALRAQRRGGAEGRARRPRAHAAAPGQQGGPQRRRRPAAQRRAARAAARPEAPALAALLRQQLAPRRRLEAQALVLAVHGRLCAALPAPVPCDLSGREHGAHARAHAGLHTEWRLAGGLEGNARRQQERGPPEAELRPVHRLERQQRRRPRRAGPQRPALQAGGESGHVQYLPDAQDPGDRRRHGGRPEVGYSISRLARAC